MNKNNGINRRNFLRGLGVTMALPMLDSLAPTKALAGAAPGSAPLRMAYFFVPNGVDMARWTPKGSGSNFELSPILQPLAPLKSDILVISGLTHDKGRANDDGPGDHARSAGVFLTGAQPLKSEGSRIRAGVSADQYAARHLGNQTRFASLELGTEGGRQGGKCDSGYSCAYSNNISWRDADTPMTKETNPRLVFERLFGSDMPKEVDENQARRARYRKSILDFVLEDASRLRRSVSGTDRMKLEEYLTAVREIETRIEKVENESRKHRPVVAMDDVPAGIPDDYAEHIRLMGDMMVLAFQSDVTRIATCMIGNAGSNRSYREIGVSDGHHSLSHHQNDPGKLKKISQINTFHVEQLAYTLQKLKAIPEGDGTMLDNCMIVYGSGLSDGNAHNNENLPILVAGRGGGRVLTGRHLQVPQETPMNNLFVSMLERAGLPGASLGDSTGSLRGLEG